MKMKTMRTTLAGVTRKNLERLQRQHPDLQTQLEDYRESRKSYDELYGCGKTAVEVGFKVPAPRKHPRG